MHVQAVPQCHTHIIGKGLAAAHEMAQGCASVAKVDQHYDGKDNAAPYHHVEVVEAAGTPASQGGMEYSTASLSASHCLLESFLTLQQQSRLHCCMALPQSMAFRSAPPQGKR